MDKKLFNQIKTIYSTCMDTGTKEKLGKKPLIDLLHKFNFYDNRSNYEGVDGFMNLVSDLYQYGVFTFLGIGIRADPTNNTSYIMTIHDQSMNYSKEDFDKEDFVSKYNYTVVETLNRLFGEERNNVEIANKIIEFEIKLANIATPAYVSS